MESKEKTEQLTEEIFDRTRHKNYSFSECRQIATKVQRIRDLKKAKDAAVFAHTYVNSEIINFVADHTGDSLSLAKAAQKRSEKNIIIAAVGFMAETAKLLNSDKYFFLGAQDDGCSLASSISENDILLLRNRHPNATFVCSINTSIGVKARCDVCVTSSNAFETIKNLATSELVFVPDLHMGAYLKRQMQMLDPDIKFYVYGGHCHVHQEFSSEEVDFWRLKFPNIYILAHPECSSEVASKANFVGSTSKISEKIRETNYENYLVLTECGLAEHLTSQNLKSKTLHGYCSICKHMKSNSLDSIERLLMQLDQSRPIEIPESLLLGAQKCVLPLTHSG